MRFVIVSSESSGLGGIGPWINLLEDTDPDSVLDTLNDAMTVTSLLAFAASIETPFVYEAFSSVLDFFDIAIPNIEPTRQTELSYKPKTNWTVVYAQILDGATWKTCSSVEYVNSSFSVYFAYFDRNENRFVDGLMKSASKTIYSQYYYDAERLKEYAVLSYTNGIMNYCAQDRVNSVKHSHGGRVVYTEIRSEENFSLIPELNE